MSFLGVAPDMVAAAAGNLESIGSVLAEANAAAAPPTIGLAAPAADQVSAAVAALFVTHAREFQSLSTQAEAFHEQFVGLLNRGAAAYLGAESNVQQTLLNAVTGPARALLGYPLLGPVAGGSSAASLIEYANLGGVSPALIGGGNTPLDIPPMSLPTPFGPVVLALNGSVTPMGDVVFDSGSLAVPSPFVYGLGAVGPVINTLTALQNSNAAFVGAVEGGNLLGAAGALVQTPGNAVTGFFFGQTAISLAVPSPANTGFESVGISVPVGGLLAPLQPVTVTLTPTSGDPTAIDLSGTRFGGLVPALLEGASTGF